MKLWFKKPVIEDAPKQPEPVNIPASTPEEELPVLTTSEPIADAKNVQTSAPASAPARVARPTQPAFRSDHKSLYKQLLGGLYDAVLVTDPKGYIIDANARVQEFFQYDSSETWDMAVGELIPGINTALIERIRQGLAGDRFVLLDARCVRKDRTTFAAEVAISSIDLMNTGDFVFSVRNVERRRNTLLKMRSSHNAMMHSLAANAACDKLGLVKLANPVLLALWGYGKEEDLVGKPLTSLWANDEHHQYVVEKALGGSLWEGLITATARNGESFKVKARLAPERDAREGVTGVACSFLECTPVQ